MGILSCEKYEDRRKIQNIKNCPFEYKYFIGKGNQNSQNENVIILDCEDNYESLPIKVKKMFEWVLNNRPQVEYIFKTDDDITFNFEKLKEQFITIHKENKDYCGYVINLNHSKSSYHIGRCDNKELNQPIEMLPAIYCAGGGYFLSKKSLKIVVSEIEKYQNIFEDYSVGKTLNKNNIYPYDINLFKNSCFW